MPGSDRFLHGSLQQEVLVHTVLFKGNVHCLYPTNGTRDDWAQGAVSNFGANRECGIQQ